MAVSASHFAFAYFLLYGFYGVALVNHIRDVFVFVTEVVKLQDARVCYTAVCAFTVKTLVSVHECFISVTLVSVLYYACLWILLVPPSRACCRAFLAGGLQSICFSFVLGVFCCGFHLSAYRAGFRAVIQ
jgi:hypothetical protein